MSLPTNSGLAKERGCNPVSSNCVVWQGPDLICIDLCKGDTISEVIAKMATELCTLIELFNLEDYDFSCLVIPVSERPNDFKDLIQILIERICALENIPEAGEGETGDCPDNCIVPIAPCFYTISASGDTITTLTLEEYVNLIGTTICDILDDITVLQNEVDTLQDQINGPAGLLFDVGELETNKVDTTALQYQVSTKTNPAGPTEFITDALRDVENSLISTQDAIGTPTEIFKAMILAGNLGQENKMFGTGLMSSIPGWSITIEDLSDTIGNQELAIADLRNAVAYIQENCCNSSCTDLFLNFSATLDISPTTVFINIFTSNSSGFNGDWKECDTNGTNIVVTDALGNSTSFRASLIPLIDIPTGFQFDLTSTPIDSTQDITVVAETCFINEASDSTCEKDYSYTIYSSVNCPPVVLTVFTSSVNYQFTTTAGFSYIVNIYLDGAPTPFATQIITNPGAVVLNTIAGLSSSIDYDFELVIINGAAVETPCPKVDFTTLPNNCTPPINASVMLVI